MNPQKNSSPIPDPDEAAKLKEAKLKEKDFIYESKEPTPIPMWLYIAIILGVLCSIWAIGNWLTGEFQGKVEDSPFLQVTNRQMSLFLWQNPEYMRIHATTKTGYLPGFNSTGNVSPKIEDLEAYVSAPPDTIFHYHTWNRLLGGYVIPRPISPVEFKEFLDSSPEWNPGHWAGAPEQYKQFVKNFDQIKTDNLQKLDEKSFPKQVRLAFLGWKNYYREGDLINKLRPTVGEIKEFINRYPNYARNYWRNLYPEYLKILLNESVDPKTIITEDELTSFLRVAFYNFTVSAEETTGKPSSAKF